MFWYISNSLAHYQTRMFKQVTNVSGEYGLVPQIILCQKSFYHNLHVHHKTLQPKYPRHNVDQMLFWRFLKHKWYASEQNLKKK